MDASRWRKAIRKYANIAELDMTLSRLAQKIVRHEEIDDQHMQQLWAENSFEL